MQEIHRNSDGNYGVPRMFTALRRAGLVVNRKKVERLMRRHGMAGRFRTRRCRTTFPGPDGYVIPALVGRRFSPGAPDVAWAQDITYIPTGEGWLYLASVLDVGLAAPAWLLDGRPHAHRHGPRCPRHGRRRPGGNDRVAGVIAHADRGSQYTANDHLDFCQARQMRPSVGMTGQCWDNSTRLHTTLDGIPPHRVGTAVPSSFITTRPADGEMPTRRLLPWLGSRGFGRTAKARHRPGHS